MKQTEMRVARKPIYYSIAFVILVILLALAIKYPFSGAGNSPKTTSMRGSNFAAGSPEKFTLLSGQGGKRSVGST